ncbi:hypothetical protein SLEP1_g28847 [Rubroshorea leprosula]|uniref:Cytochrome P450 n=1 Tax=Rubroshorea leprosula TaxID=152421 RepID=A0AAV5K0P4_9ROSI|nr:hypothetical protein SLEP1_g28847 [Rubroshorea leprosula]
MVGFRGGNFPRSPRGAAGIPVTGTGRGGIFLPAGRGWRAFCPREISRGIFPALHNPSLTLGFSRTIKLSSLTSPSTFLSPSCCYRSTTGLLLELRQICCWSCYRSAPRAAVKAVSCSLQICWSSSCCLCRTPSLLLLPVTSSQLQVGYVVQLTQYICNVNGRNTNLLPPGPLGLPFIGNLHQLDNSSPHIYLYQLSQKYGPLMSLKLGFRQTLVVSSAKMAKEVLKTHEIDFCSRPALFGLQKLSYNGLDLAFTPYRSYWKEIRKVCVTHLFNPTFYCH